jgi:hypothetical protein
MANSINRNDKEFSWVENVFSDLSANRTGQLQYQIAVKVLGTAFRMAGSTFIPHMSDERADDRIRISCLMRTRSCKRLLPQRNFESWIAV